MKLGRFVKGLSKVIILQRKDNNNVAPRLSSCEVCYTVREVNTTLEVTSVLECNELQNGFKKKKSTYIRTHCCRSSSWSLGIVNRTLTTRQLSLCTVTTAFPNKLQTEICRYRPRLLQSTRSRLVLANDCTVRHTYNLLQENTCIRLTLVALNQSETASKSTTAIDETHLPHAVYHSNELTVFGVPTSPVYDASPAELSLPSGVC